MVFYFKRIQTFLTSILTNKRFDALGLISIKSNLVAEIKDLYEKVVNILLMSRNWLLDLIYKLCG